MSHITFQRSDYPNIRTAIMDICDKILKSANKDDLSTCARHLGLWHKKTFVFNNEIETNVLWDYLVYSYSPNGLNMAEKYLRINRSHLDEFSQDLLTRMSEAYYALIVVEEVVKEGELRVKDIFRGSVFTLVDKALSQSLTSGQAFAGHILSFDGFSIQSGAALPVAFELVESEAVLKVISKFDFNPEKASFIPNQADSAKLARVVISTAIRLGYTDKVSHV